MSGPVGPSRSKPVAEAAWRALQDLIADGSLSPGDRLPSERELSLQLGISRSTLRQALISLEHAGVVVRRPGRAGGTFVAKPKVTRDLSEIAGLPAYLRRQGFRVGTQVVSTSLQAAEASVRRDLNLAVGALIVRIVRVRLADGTPISLETAKFPAERFPGLLDQPLSGSLYELFEVVYDVRAGHASEEIEVVTAAGSEAELLDVSVGFPLIAVRRVAVDVDGVAFETSHDLFRSDRTKIIARTAGAGVSAGRAEREPAIGIQMVVQ